MPRAWSSSSNATAPEKRYAPSTINIGFQAAKITSATAMKPRPATMFSDHVRANAVESWAPPRPARPPPIATANQRTGRWSMPIDDNTIGRSPAARILRPVAERKRNHQAIGAMANDR